MAEMSIQVLKKLTVLLLLTVSFILALAGFYLILTKWAEGGDNIFPLFMSILVTVLALLIMAMIIRVVGDLREVSKEEN
ncbi:MAG: hypothetical protein JSV43_08760 [Methanobacteriota archaeon]|nr:MAG: hypothetical protein JSV43_08760 [Euryarchaeota archaeon]